MRYSDKEHAGGVQKNSIFETVLQPIDPRTRGGIMLMARYRNRAKGVPLIPTIKTPNYQDSQLSRLPTIKIRVCWGRPHGSVRRVHHIEGVLYAPTA